MSEFLKGNFKVKNQIQDIEAEKAESAGEKLKSELRKAALNSIGGSMVYVERTDFTWNGDAEGAE